MSLKEKLKIDERIDEFTDFVLQISSNYGLNYSDAKSLSETITIKYIHDQNDLIRELSKALEEIR